jgi:hypothetical protein
MTLNPLWRFLEPNLPASRPAIHFTKDLPYGGCIQLLPVKENWK